MGERALVPVKVILFGLSGGNVLVVKEEGRLKLPETWLARGETLCAAASRLAQSLVGSSKHVKIVAVVWFTEAREPEYHLVFAVEGFIDVDIVEEEKMLMLRVGDAAKLVDDPVHRTFLEIMHHFKPRPLLVCSL